MMLYFINGAAYLMMTPAALIISNLLMASLILLYGLVFELVVTGLPVYYLLTPYCQ